MSSPPKDSKCRTKKSSKHKIKQNILMEACNDFKIFENLNYIYDYDDSDNEHTNSHVVIGEIKPRNENQSIYLEYLQDKRNQIVLATGAAGTGKSYCAIAYALRETFEYKNYNKIIITRPSVNVSGEAFGFLKGDLNEKMCPYMQPLYDIMEKYIKKNDLKYYIDEKIIEICPLAFIRGRTFENSIVLCDECQNTTSEQVKALLTRIGESVHK